LKKLVNQYFGTRSFFSVFGLTLTARLSTAHLACHDLEYFTQFKPAEYFIRPLPEPQVQREAWEAYRQARLEVQQYAPPAPVPATPGHSTFHIANLSGRSTYDVLNVSQHQALGVYYGSPTGPEQSSVYGPTTVGLRENFNSEDRFITFKNKIIFRAADDNITGDKVLSAMREGSFFKGDLVFVFSIDSSYLLPENTPTMTGYIFKKGGVDTFCRKLQE